MGKLTKILAPLVAVLAIAACVISILAYLEFKKYKARSTKLATTLLETATKLDEGSESGKLDSVTFSPTAPGSKESGTLSFRDNRKDTTSLDLALATVKELSEKVIEQRKAMADALQELSISIKNNGVKSEELCKFETYPEKLSLAKSYAKALYDMDNEFASRIEAIGKQVGISVSLARTPRVNGNSASKVDNNANMAKVSAAVDALLKQKAAYEAAIKAIETDISKHAFSSRPRDISAGNYTQKLPALKKDLAAINNKLVELEKVKKDLAAAQATIRQKDQQIAKLNQEKQDLQKEVAKLREELEQLKAEAEDASVVSEDGKTKKKAFNGVVDPETRGTILLDNKEWNFVVCDLGNDKVVVGTEVIIAHKGVYLGSGKISKVEESVSVIEISRREAKVFPVGAIVMMGSSVGNK